MKTQRSSFFVLSISLSLLSFSLAPAATETVLQLFPAFELVYDTETGSTYQLQSSTNLTNWINAAPAVGGTGTQAKTFVSTTNSPQQFYRVIAFNLLEGLNAYYPLNGDGTDATANGNNGVLSSPFPTTNRLGAAGSALHFNGAGDGVVIGDAPQINFTNAFTLSAWIRFEAGGTDNPRIIAKATIATDGYQLLTEGTGTQRKFNCTIGLEGTGYVGVVSMNFYPAGMWHHVVATFDGSTIRLYINGVADGMIGASGSIKQTATQLHLGRQSAYDADYFLGDMDEVRLYNRALSSEEITLLFATQQ